MTEYKDPETYEKVRNFRKIAFRYMFKGSFIVDLLGSIPYRYMTQ